MKELHIFAAKARIAAIEGIYNADGGHPGGSLSIIDTLTYLYQEQMSVRPREPLWEMRDRFVLSKGHAAPALYAVLALSGFFPVSQLTMLRSLGSLLQGHPSMKNTPGVDMSTGSLGQGISTACGMALSGKLSQSPWKVYTILGDCELEEGQVWEAMMFASYQNLDNLCIIIDNNNYNIDGAGDDSHWPYYPVLQKCEAFGAHVIQMDGHDFTDIERAFKKAEQNQGKPTVIIQKSVKGKGVSFMENKSSWHGAVPDKLQFEQALSELLGSIRRYKDE